MIEERERRVMGLKNKVVLITGSTGELGRVVVETFVNASCQVIGTYRNEKAYQELQKRLNTPSNLRGISVSLTDEDSVNQLFEEIRNRYGCLDALLHLAGGFWMGGTLWETPLAEWQRMMDMNMLTTFLCARGAAEIMKTCGGGSIVLVSAAVARDLPAGMGSYAISKSAVLNLATILAKEGKPYHIRVNAILPTIIDTAANRRAMPDADVSQWIPPQKIAAVLSSLVAEEMDIVSGSAIQLM